MGAVFTVGIFSVILAVVPLWVFSDIRHGRLDWLLSRVLGDSIIVKFSKDTRVLLGGVVAIVLVNIVIFFFILVAFVFEPRVSEKTREGTKDK